MLQWLSQPEAIQINSSITERRELKRKLNREQLPLKNSLPGMFVLQSLSKVARTSIFRLISLSKS
jgi:hypothetical protein